MRDGGKRMEKMFQGIGFNPAKNMGKQLLTHEQQQSLISVNWRSLGPYSRNSLITCELLLNCSTSECSCLLYKDGYIHDEPMHPGYTQGLLERLLVGFG